YVLLQSFVNYAANKGVPARWYYINISANLIVNQLKALIARDIVGLDGYFEIMNSTDPVVLEAIKQLESGGANFPLSDE
ncbi:MAG: peptidase S41, partial [Muribaculaceae bacterium]|nr:peptidase S41 [Muribaculaceae bacterium]